MPRSGDEYRWLLAALAVSTLAVVAFLNGLGGDFVLDDRPFLLNNPKLVTAHSLSWFFTENLWYYSNIPDAFSNSYRPLYFLILWLLNYLGMADPLGLHLFSLTLHIIVTLLVLRMIRRLVSGISPLAAGLGAALFAVHPVHAEAIAWSSAFTHPLAAALLLAAWFAHDNFQRKSNIAMASAAIALFGLALLINEMAVAFPIFVLVSDWIRFGLARIHRSLPYFLMLIIYGYTRNVVLGISLPLEILDPVRWVNIPVFLLEYLRHLVAPWPQPLFVTMPENWPVSAGALLATSLSIIAVMWLVRIPADNRKVFLVAAAWIVAFIVPPMAATLSPDALFALRSLYVPSAGLALMLAWVIDNTQKVQRPPGLAITAAVLLFGIGATAANNRHWANDGLVYTRIIASNPGHHAGYLGLGQFHEREGNFDEAISQYRKSVRLADLPEKTVAMEYLAILLAKTGDTSGSLDIFRQMTTLEPENISAWVGVGNNLWTQGELEAASEAYQKAHSLDPGNQAACYNLVLVLKRLGRTEEAARYAECAQNPY